MNSPKISFLELGVPLPIVQTLETKGITDAFPIQVDTLPDTLAGRDVLGRGKTGSGKTLAFSIPLVVRLAASQSPNQRQSARPRGLILAPTRELANQIDEVLRPLAAAYRLKTTTIYGGVNQKRQVDALRGGVDIVVACPGRLEDLLQQRLLTLDGIEITILDEADHMADLGFLPVVTRLLERIPRTGQRLLFSATLDGGVDKLVKRFLSDPVVHSVDDVSSHVDEMTHHVFEVSNEKKKDLVTALASGKGRRILFTRTKHQAKKLAKQLTAQGIPAVDLHGNLSQPKRDRNLAAFSAGDVMVLVATDVAARGVHVDSVELVVHVDPPMEHKSYLHRSGRTARAGNAGDVVTVVLPEQRRDTAALLRKADIRVTPVSVTPGSPAVRDLVGEVAAYVKPVPITAPPARTGKSQGANARRKRSAQESYGTKSAASAGRGSQSWDSTGKRPANASAARQNTRSPRVASRASGSPQR